MGIIVFMTTSTLLRRLPELLLVCMATRASHLLMRPDQGEICVVMLECIAIQRNNIRLSSFVFRVALLAVLAL